MSILGEKGITKVLSGHQKSITALKVDQESGLFYTSDVDGIICKWSIDSDGSMNPVRFHGGDAHIFTGAVHGGIIKSLDLIDDKLISTGWDDVYRISDCMEEKTHTAKSLPSQPLASASNNDFIFILCVNCIACIGKNTEIVSTMENISYSPTCISLSSDGSLLSVGSDDMKIRIYSVASDGKLSEINILSGHAKAVTATSFSPDGAYLASGDSKDIIVWNVSDMTSVCKGRWCFHTSKITDLVWSSDNRILASCGQDENIFLWCLNKKMKRVHYSYVHRGGVTSMSFLDNETLLSVGVDGCVCKWSVGKDIKDKFG